MSAQPKLKITGLGVAYPPNLVSAEEFDKLTFSHFNHSPALDKTLAINHRSGIKTRSVVVSFDAPFLNQPTAPSIEAISDLILVEGLALAVSAARPAIAEAGISVDEITHVVASSCTSSSNPGFDFLLARELGLRPTVEKVLLHGVGCSGGLAGLRFASSLCHAAAWRGRAANVLVVASEIMSSLARNGLERVDRDQDVRVGLAIFAHGASALVLSLDCGTVAGSDEETADERPETGIFEVVNSTHMIIPETENILTFDVGSQGWNETMSHQLPILAESNIPILYENLISSLPESTLSLLPHSPSEFDWPIHTGGTAFLNAAQKAMRIERENLQASWEIYEHHGNTSSSSVFCVLDMSRRIQHREWAMSLAFGPGLVGEAVLLRRLRPRRREG